MTMLSVSPEIIEYGCFCTEEPHDHYHYSQTGWSLVEFPDGAAVRMTNHEAAGVLLQWHRGIVGPMLEEVSR